MTDDIRTELYLNHEDILGLNFIRDPGVYLYRRHYRAGLRSHLMEILNPEDVEKEKKGIIIDGLRWFPRAKPLKMLRIFRMKFNGLREAEKELMRVKIIAAYLAPGYIARSEEFLVDYKLHRKHELLLCGLQELIEGEILDPWRHPDRSHLVCLFQRFGFEKGEDHEMIIDRWIRKIRSKAEIFIEKLKRMILEANYIPDLAGVGNLLITRSGDIKLVDINNISRVSFGATINLDDRGYPVCDKSIEALSLLEQTLLGRSIDRKGVIYKIFLDAKRMEEVKALEKEFHVSMEPAGYA